MVVIIWELYLKTLSAQTYCEYAKVSGEANMSDFHDIHEYSIIQIIRRGHKHHLISELMFISCFDPNDGFSWTTLCSVNAQFDGKYIICLRQVISTQKMGFAQLMYPLRLQARVCRRILHHRTYTGQFGHCNKDSLRAKILNVKFYT